METAHFPGIRFKGRDQVEVLSKCEVFKKNIPVYFRDFTAIIHLDDFELRGESVFRVNCMEITKLCWILWP